MRTRNEYVEKSKQENLEMEEKKNEEKRARMLCKRADDVTKRWRHVGSKFQSVGRQLSA